MAFNLQRQRLEQGFNLPALAMAAAASRSSTAGDETAHCRYAAEEYLTPTSALKLPLVSNELVFWLTSLEE